MNGFTIAQVPSEKILGHKNVLKDRWTTRGTRMTGRTHHHETGLVPHTTTFPVAVRRSGNASRDCIDRRLDLFGAITLAHVSGATRRAANVTTRRPKDALTLLASTAPHVTKVTSSCHTAPSTVVKSHAPTTSHRWPRCATAQWDPPLKILRPVIVTCAVDVIDRPAVNEVPTHHFPHAPHRSCERTFHRAHHTARAMPRRRGGTVSG
jgi:hypothetical protein